MEPLSAIFWFVLAIIFALVEIEIEGKYGWAENASTWYRVGGKFNKVFYPVVGLKPLTGYHLFMFPLTLMVFHSGFFVGAEWSAAKELSLLATYMVWCVTWDFLWFVFNPFYGVRKFKKEKVWWHAKSKWLMGLFPVDYSNAIVLSFVLTVIVNLIDSNFTIIAYLKFLGVFVLLSLVAIIFAPLYKRWYLYMRKQDDRGKAEIFH